MRVPSFALRTVSNEVGNPCLSQSGVEAAPSLRSSGTRRPSRSLPRHSSPVKPNSSEKGRLTFITRPPASRKAMASGEFWKKCSRKSFWTRRASRLFRSWRASWRACFRKKKAAKRRTSSREPAPQPAGTTQSGRRSFTPPSIHLDIERSQGESSRVFICPR